MAIQGVDTKCYILALFIRDDDERFLLGSGQFEFKDTQKQFEANAIQNDVVEVQGNDGYLLAGQVRRSGTQNFDGYVGDGTMAKTEVEENRRKFFAFYQKNHFYRVVYVFPDGTAIQRKRGFLVDDPTVEELYQQYPEYHVALNFEDVNYYSYSENEQGEEEYAKEAIIELSTLRATGGLIWDEYGAVSDGFAWGGETTATGSEITIQNELDLPVPVSDVRLNGDTEQQTYSGKNLLNLPNSTRSSGGIDWTNTDGISTGSGTATGGSSLCTNNIPFDLQPGSYTFSIQNTLPYEVQLNLYNGSSWITAGRISSGRKYSNFSVTGTYTQWRMGVAGWSTGDTINLTVRQPMLEAGGGSTDYEPYVGGVPAPNPDYPQDIEVVTGEQTVTNAGINLLPPPQNFEQDVNGLMVKCVNGEYTINGNASSGTSTGVKNTIAEYTIQAGDYFHYNNDLVSSRINIALRFSDNTQFANSMNVANRIISLASYVGKTVVGVNVNFNNGYDFAGTAKPMIVNGVSTVTDFEAYRSQIYLVDLGATELTKIGNYQDYIYKSGDDWYIHKAIGKVVFDGTESWTGQNSNNYFTCDVADALIITDAGVLSPIISTAYSSATPGNIYSGSIDYGISLNSGTARIRVRNKDCANSTAMKAWFSSNSTTAYYALATPTDTQITDTDLIDALNALNTTKLFVGENNISATPTGSNLPAELQLKYYTSVDYTGAGYIWEEGGSGGPTIIDNASITNVYPIWTVYGPAVNPTLSVITTNTTLSYTGTVAAFQTLVIDMLNKTAKLNGTSVIGNVSGDWVNFAPGINRIVYDTDNSDTPPSLAQWQEVVG